MKVVIVDYNAGNIFSVQQSFRRLGVETVLSKSEEEIRSASHIVFPGVGHAEKAMAELRKTGLDAVIPTLEQPFLGICLGMQLMCEHSEEGDVKGLGIFETKVVDMKSGIFEKEKMRNSEFENSGIREFDKYRRSPGNTGDSKWESAFQFPHTGWNDVQCSSTSEAYYFVHSYAAGICAQTAGITVYPFPFSAILRKDNFLGVQFHPEKSGKQGEELLIQFLRS